MSHPVPAHTIILIDLLGRGAVLFVNEDGEADSKSGEEGWWDGRVGFGGEGRRVAGACCGAAGWWEDGDCGSWHGWGWLGEVVEWYGGYGVWVHKEVMD